MNTYEALIIFKPMIDVEGNDDAVKAIEASVTKKKGKVLKVDKMGRKRLAYDIQKFKDGQVAAFALELPAKAVEAFRRDCKLNEDILRCLVVRRDRESLLAERKSEEEVPRRGGDRRRRAS